MTAKKWSEQLRKWREQNAEHYARTILEKPENITLYKSMPFPGVVLVMGDIRQGKSALAHEVVHQFRSRQDREAVLHLPGVDEKTMTKVQRLLPRWFKVVNNRKKWPEHSIVVYDEAAQSAHSRRSQSKDALELDDLTSIAGQRDQLILFISHYSRKLDVNLVTAVKRIVWKAPTYAHKLWERQEMSDFTSRAFDFFRDIPRESTRKRTALILDMEQFKFLQCTNGLAPWWSDELSTIFKIIELNGKGGVG